MVGVRSCVGPLHRVVKGAGHKGRKCRRADEGNLPYVVWLRRADRGMTLPGFGWLAPRPLFSSVLNGLPIFDPCVLPNYDHENQG